MKTPIAWIDIATHDGKGISNNRPYASAWIGRANDYSTETGYINPAARHYCTISRSSLLRCQRVQIAFLDRSVQDGAQS